MKHITANLILVSFTILILFGSCEYEYYVIPAPKPQVSSTDPANNDTAVSLKKTVKVSFSVPMNTSSINWTTFTLAEGTTPVAGTVACTGTDATFVPTASLKVNTFYTGTISSAVYSTAGIHLTKDYSWTFKTGHDTASTDTTIVVVDSISFAQDIVPIFAAKCTICHSGSTPPDLRASKAYTSLVGGNLVVSKDPDNSTLYKEVKAGGGMATYASASDVSLIKRWILAGIKNN